jgi:hypothetical protein
MGGGSDLTGLHLWEWERASQLPLMVSGRLLCLSKESLSESSLPSMRVNLGILRFTMLAQGVYDPSV